MAAAPAKSKAEDESHDCCICLQTVWNGNEPIVDVGAFVCGHVLHFSCASQYLEGRKVCPICRCSFEPFPRAEWLVAVQPSSAPRHTESYAQLLLALCAEARKRHDVVRERRETLLSRQCQLQQEVRELVTEVASAIKSESALRGLWQRELTARAEAESARHLRDCAVENRKALTDAVEAKAALLRELHELDERVNELRVKVQHEKDALGYVGLKRRRPDETVI